MDNKVGDPRLARTKHSEVEDAIAVHELGIHDGDEVDFVFEGDQFLINIALTHSLELFAVEVSTSPSISIKDSSISI